MKTLILTTLKDFTWMEPLYPKYLSYLPSEEICFVGCADIQENVNRLIDQFPEDQKERITYINENDIIPIEDVRNCIQDKLKNYLGNESVPNKIVGWHYQQFLKMAYARICSDDYYMVWDGDTVPTAPFAMFDESGVPFFDMKHEDNPLYFSTLAKIIPGMKKVVSKSFVSEHMVIKKDYMCELLDCIESNESLEGKVFWEKIIGGLDPKYMGSADFSEFETYGSFVCVRHLGSYRMRNWHSLRWAGDYFEPNTISDDDMKWLSRDLQALSFEKGVQPTEEAKGILANKAFQEKLSPRQIIEILQEGLPDYFIKEYWDD